MVLRNAEEWSEIFLTCRTASEPRILALGLCRVSLPIVGLAKTKTPALPKNDLGAAKFLMFDSRSARSHQKEWLSR